MATGPGSTSDDGPTLPPPSPRPDLLVVIGGTGTEVGKTWVACRTLAVLRRRGVRVAARKPAQSFAAPPGIGTAAAGPGGATDADLLAAAAAGGATDADLLAAATGEKAPDVCPPHRWYPVAMAPPMAADVLRRPPIRLVDLVAETRWPRGVEVGLVEGAGGLASPLAEDGDTLAFARAAGADLVVVVADAGLGTIHACRLAALACRTAGIDVVVVLNRFSGDCDLHRRNRDWLRDRDGLSVVTGPEGLADLLLVRLGDRAPRGQHHSAR